MRTHDELLEQWSRLPHHDPKSFVYDGMIDSARWAAAKRKVVFVLREAYNEPGDLRNLIRDQWKGPWGHTWHVLSTWAYLALHGSHESVPPFPERRRHADELREALLSTAVVNIKKSGGKSGSSWKDLARFAELDGALIREQMELIEPQLAICGNVWRLISHAWPDARPAYDLVAEAGRMRIVDFWHPAFRVASNLKYYALAALLQNSASLGRRKNAS